MINLSNFRWVYTNKGQFAAREVNMLKTPEVAQNDCSIEISLYADQEYDFFSAFGHALFSQLAKTISQLMSTVVTFLTHQIDRNGHIYIIEL